MNVQQHFSDDLRREQRLRRLAQREGFALQKSRRRITFPLNINDFGGYRRIDPYTSGIVFGSRFELDLDDVERFLTIDTE
jgi:hypothetical protein